MGPRRARQIHEKEARRQDILAAARQVWDEVPYPALSMALVARQAELAKGTLYIYFKTKEELFLVLAEEELLSCFEELDEAIGRLEGLPSPGQLAALFAGAFASVSRLPGLLAILPTALEHNVGHLTALRFNQFLSTRILRTGRLLERHVPYILEGQGARVVLRVHALAMGLGQLSHRAPVVDRILSAPGLQLFRVDFLPELEGTLREMFTGIAVSPRPVPEG